MIRIWDSATGSAFAASKEFRDRSARAAFSDFLGACEAEDFGSAKQLALKALDGDGDRNCFDDYHLALVLAAEHDHRAADLCARMLRKYQDSQQPVEAGFVAWTFALVPDATLDKVPAIELVRRALAKEPEEAQHVRNLGALLMRSGHYVEAKGVLEKLLETKNDLGLHEIYIRYFLAMTEHHLGNTGRARRHWEEGNRLSSEKVGEKVNWNQRLTIQLLRSESEALLGDVGK